MSEDKTVNLTRQTMAVVLRSNYPDIFSSTAVAQRALEAVLDSIVQETNKGHNVVFREFGSFQRISRAARTGRNPRTGIVIDIKECTVLTFKAARSLRK